MNFKTSDNSCPNVSSEGLVDEFHRRAPLPAPANTLCRHLVFLYEDDTENESYSDLLKFCAQVKTAEPDTEDRQFLGEVDGVRFKWERHTEFATYSFYHNGQASSAFHAVDPPDLAAACVTCLDRQPLLGAQVRFLEACQKLDAVPKTPPAVFSDTNISGGVVCDDHAEIWSDFRVGNDGFCRLVVMDRGLGPKRAGRLLQRLLDVETYRIVALLGLEQAHLTNVAVARIERQLHALLENSEFHSGETPDRQLLGSLLSLASQTEQLLSTSSFRFDATRAYARLVIRRLDELDEQRIQGAQRLSNFLKRRFVPAMETCEAARDRLHDLTGRIHRDAALMRTRIDIVRQEQSTALLSSMNQRAHLQFKLQQTVEAISAIAISYYSIGIFGVLVKPASQIWPSVSPAILTSVAAPVIIAGVSVFIRRVRRRSERIEIERAAPPAKQVPNN